MKLHAADYAARDDGRVRRAVLRRAEHVRFVGRVAEVRVDEVEEGLILDAFGERVCLAPPDLIPTDLRHAQAFWEAPHAPAQEAEPARRAELLRLLEEHLHPDADAEQRRPRALTRRTRARSEPPCRRGTRRRRAARASPPRAARARPK